MPVVDGHAGRRLAGGGPEPCTPGARAVEHRVGQSRPTDAGSIGLR